jgi:hypothetical protein
LHATDQWCSGRSTHPSRAARSSRKSLNKAAIDALAEGAGLAGKQRKRRILTDICRHMEAKGVEAALAADEVDEDLE